MRRRIARKLKIPKLTWKTQRKKLSRKKELKTSVKSKKVIGARQDKLRRQKNYFLSLLIIILLWSSLGSYIYLVDPDKHGTLLLFLVLSAITLVFTFSFLLVNTRRGIIVSLSIVFFLMLRYFGIGNVINAILVSSLATVIDKYTKK